MSENWAICVGINNYVNLQPLEFAEQDAEALRDFFRGEIVNRQRSRKRRVNCAGGIGRLSSGVWEK
jgi:hypothetical protein